MKHSKMPGVSLAAMIATMPRAAIGAPRMEVAGGVEKLLADVRQELTRVGDDVRRTAEDALKQTKEQGALSAETKALADQGLSKMHELQNVVSTLTGKLEGLEARNTDLEQALAGAGGKRGSAAQSLGAEIAGSAELKNWLAGGAQGGLTLRPTNAVTTAGGSGGGVIWSGEDRAVAGMAMQKLAIRSLLTVATTESDVVIYSKQTTRTKASATVAEGAAAPAGELGWTQAEANVRKIAEVIHASDEALADSGQLQSLIDQELRYSLDLEEEEQILAGNGVGQNLSGLITEATAFSAAAGLANATRIDRLRLGLLQVALANYAANGVTLNPVDWAAIELLKDTQGRFIFGNPNTSATPRLWGLDVVPTLSHSAGEWMVGNFAMAATLYDRQETEVLISSEHGTNFVDGLKTVKGTKRLALACKRPAALVTGDFTFA